MAHSSAISKSVAVRTADQAVSADSDMAIVRQVQAGDVAAFDRLTVKYRERLFSVVYNLTSNREDANDLTQDAFIKAFRSINKFKGRSSFFTWLYRIAVNGAISHLKKNRLRRFFSLEDLNESAGSKEILDALAVKTGTEKPALLNELQEKLNEALQKLSLKHRTVVVLFEIEGLSHQEIAEVTKTSEGTVRSRLHYAKQQLQSSLSDYLA
ncbi:sigma-70 family RNA polymerase sigma factor [Rubellicoccus peritrichatus]|uniref:Sigma-70 family RNA polymerase sigma factor n=1 Tax=Rubellicoccus peritrichatus TaxID=3080537 RepID=A0AAQ3QTA0_9BACT|nr:sigma-70 family RNA polymerase sigma factor [Puniceicoccus sp. CR14]WOO41101.1 sigma-70 family RNA polymerase sigma factor [Puniceicoccus sp. CR14]